MRMTATDTIPGDRVVIDGVEQSCVLLLIVTHGRSDYVHIVEGATYKSVLHGSISVSHSYKSIRVPQKVRGGK